MKPRRTKITTTKSRVHAVCICACAILFTCAVYRLEFFAGIERKAGDFLDAMRPSKGASERIGVIAVDETTVNALSWPVTRDYYFTLIRILNEYRARSIVFDIACIDENKNHPEWDTLLAVTTADTSLHSRIVHSFYFIVSEWRDARYDDSGIRRFSLPAPPGNRFLQALSADKPFPLLLAHTQRLGHFHLTTDSDGVHRRLPLCIAYHDRIYPGIALLAAQHYFENAGLTIQSDAALIDRGGSVITAPIDRNGDMAVVFNGNGENFPTLSLLEVLQAYKTAQQIGVRSAALAGAVSGRVVFVGATAPALGDFGAIPANRAIPKVYIHAGAADAIINETFFRPLPPIVLAALITVTAILIAAACLTWSAVHALLIWLCMVLAWCAGAAIMRRFLVTAPLGMPVTALLLCYTGLAAYAHFFKERKMGALESALGKYVSPGLCAKIDAGVNTLVEEQQEREITILFSDIERFSALCAAIDKKELHRMMTEYLNAMAGIILNNCGTVDKYIGDGIMAYFDKEEDAGHAVMAVRAAVAMLEQVTLLNKKWAAEKRPAIALRIGINTGVVLIGDLGTEHFSDYTIFGSEVNIAQRMETSAEPGSILVSRSTYEQTRDAFDYMDRGLISLKNIPAPMGSYRVMGKKMLFKGAAPQDV